ncbi:MAG: hypothetical protein AAFN77_01395 [Planctomycetota bacterium]
MAESFMSHIKTINSSVRTLLIAAACGVVGYGGYLGYENYVKPSQEAQQAIAKLETLELEYKQQTELLQLSQQELQKTTIELDAANELNERLETSMKLLKVDRRVANIKVLDKGVDDEGNPFLDVSFMEVDEKGEPVGIIKNYTLKGDKFYVDGWIATFEDKYVEGADELRSASLFVFKSIYGDEETPKNGQRLDIESIEHGPGIYNDAKKRDFEQQIWKDFWRVCSDINLQRELGIRTSQGQASYVMPRVGKTYEISIRASGGMSLKPIDEP